MVMNKNGSGASGLREPVEYSGRGLKLSLKRARAGQYMEVVSNGPSTQADVSCLSLPLPPPFPADQPTARMTFLRACPIKLYVSPTWLEGMNPTPKVSGSLERGHPGYGLAVEAPTKQG